MKWSVQIVRPSTHNVGSTSVLVHFPTGRYLFNCAEGTQRLSFENKVRVSKLSAIFLTRVDWDSMGGLPGMLLTLADTGSRNLTISGGHNLTHALAATRHFILRSEMGIRVNEMRDGDAAAAYKDENLKVTPVHIYPDNYKVTNCELGPDESEEAKTRKMLVARSLGTQQPLPQQTAAEKRKSKKEASRQQQQQQRKKGYYDEPCDGASIEKKLQMLERQQLETARMKKRARSPEQSSRPAQAFDMLLPKTEPTPASICYIAEGPEVPGKFDVQAAKALGLKQGPLYGKLTRGESVTAPDGSIIHPWQCVGPARLSGIFIIVDCPTPAYIDSLVNNPRFAPFLGARGDEESANMQKRLLLIVHSLGPGVAQDKRYKDWAARFPSHVRHMVSAPEYVPDENPFQRHLRVQAAMAVIDPQAYVLPQSADKPELSIRSFIDSEKAIVPKSLMTFDVEPKPQFDCSKVQKMQSPEEMLKWARDRAGLDKDLQQPALRTTRAEDQKEVAGVKVTNGGASKDQLIVCPIGTGSSVPSIYRNVSANIISVKGYGGIVLDCGESTVSLLKRFLGYPEHNKYNVRIDLCYTEFVSSLKLLYISHMHADHHLGAILLLHEWNQLTKDMDAKPRLSIVAPARFMAWIEDYSGVQDLGLDRIDFVSCHDIRLLHEQHQGVPSRKAIASASVETNVSKIKRDLGIADLATCSVIHCPWAYGLSITHESGWKLVYSGDTRPCTNLVTLGRHGDKLPTVLLHEATHSDDLIKDAIAKRHTTVSEAVAMALGMGAENLLMTHFSQRCLSLPRWSASRAKEQSLPRYGNLYEYSNGKTGASTSSAGMAAGEAEEEEEAASDEEDFDDETPASTEGAHEAQEALLRELSEPLSDTEDGDSVASEQSQDILECLNIATAFDMSAYAPSDIARYRFNTRRLRKVLREEIRLFIAEESESVDKEVVDSDKMKPIDAKAPNKREKSAKGKSQLNK